MYASVKISAPGIIRAAVLATALFGTTAVIAGFVFPDQAFAESGKEKGGGNSKAGGNGNGNGKSGGNDNSSNKSNGASNLSGNQMKSSSKSGNPKAHATESSLTGNRIAKKLGVSASDLGALNAAHASASALENAAPNSRVGRIAAFRDAVLAGQALEGDLALAQAELDKLDPPARPVSDIQADLDIAADARELTEIQLTQLRLDLAAAGGTDALIESEIVSLEETLSLQNSGVAVLETEQQHALAYDDATTAVEDLQAQLELQPQIERDLLQNAANKPVTDAIEEAVEKMLGL